MGDVNYILRLNQITTLKIMWFFMGYVSCRFTMMVIMIFSIFIKRKDLREEEHE